MTIMNPEDINKINKKKTTIKKIDKFCPKCKCSYSVSDYVSKCPACKSKLIYCKQPNEATPRCPTCSSTNIKKISELRRGVHAAAWGLLSTTARSQFECKNCGYKW